MVWPFIRIVSSRLLEWLVSQQGFGRNKGIMFENRWSALYYSIIWKSQFILPDLPDFNHRMLMLLVWGKLVLYFAYNILFCFSICLQSCPNFPFGLAYKLETRPSLPTLFHFLYHFVSYPLAYQINCLLLNFSFASIFTSIFKVLHCHSNFVKMLSECQIAWIRMRRRVTRRLHTDPSCLHMAPWLCLVG